MKWLASSSFSFSSIWLCHQSRADFFSFFFIVFFLILFIFLSFNASFFSHSWPSCFGPIEGWTGIVLRCNNIVFIMIITIFNINTLFITSLPYQSVNLIAELMKSLISRQRRRPTSQSIIQSARWLIFKLFLPLEIYLNRFLRWRLTVLLCSSSFSSSSSSSSSSSP